MSNEKSSRVAGMGADVDIPSGVNGKDRTGRSKARRIKVIVRHRAPSRSVNTGGGGRGRRTGA